MEKLILTLHIIVCVVLVILVLLQSGKEGMGVIFGGGSSSLFGSTGAGGILVKLTTFIAVIFLATSLSYNIVTSAKTSRHSTVIDIPLDDPSAPSRPATSTNATSPAGSIEPAKTPSNATDMKPDTPASTPAQAPVPSEAVNKTPEGDSTPSSQTSGDGQSDKVPSPDASTSKEQTPAPTSGGN